MILFLCVANSARSQIAEGLARSMVDDDVGIWSAGSSPSGLHPLAAEVLEEQGITVTGHYSKGLNDVPMGDVDTVVTLCEEEMCPALLEDATHVHWPMPDPAVVGGGPAAERGAFRAVRDEIQQRLHVWLRASGLAAIS